LIQSASIQVLAVNFNFICSCRSIILYEASIVQFHFTILFVFALSLLLWIIPRLNFSIGKQQVKQSSAQQYSEHGPKDDSPFRNCTLELRIRYHQQQQHTLCNYSVFQWHAMKGQVFVLSGFQNINRKPTFGVSKPTAMGAMMPITLPQLFTIEMMVGA